MKFTWSDAKRESNLKRHGIDFVDALEIFCAHGVLYPDTGHFDPEGDYL